jgi:hypothetical protein
MPGIVLSKTMDDRDIVAWQAEIKRAPRRRPGGASTVGVRLAGRWPGRWLQQTSWVQFPPKVRSYPQLHERRRGYNFHVRSDPQLQCYCMRGYAAPAPPLRPAAPACSGARAGAAGRIGGAGPGVSPLNYRLIPPGRRPGGAAGPSSPPPPPPPPTPVSRAGGRAGRSRRRHRRLLRPFEALSRARRRAAGRVPHAGRQVQAGTRMRVLHTDLPQAPFILSAKHDPHWHSQRKASTGGACARVTECAQQPQLARC